MDIQGLLLKLTLREFENLGLNVSINTFNGRKNVQKLVYLLQKDGFPFSYFFRWYIRGPYSPALTTDFFNVAQDAPEYYEQLANGYRLHEALVQRITTVLEPLRKSGLIDDSGESMARSDLEEGLELAASARYLVEEEGYSPDEAAKVLHERKPQIPHDKQVIRKYLQSIMQ
jgi:hypothetical protein